MSEFFDTDGDGFADTGFADADGDGYFETAVVDTNADGYYETAIVDADHDGYYDSVAVDVDGDTTIDYGTYDFNEDGIAEGVFGEDASVPGLAPSSTDANQLLIDNATLDASHDAQTQIFESQTEIDQNLLG